MQRFLVKLHQGVLWNDGVNALLNLLKNISIVGGSGKLIFAQMSCRDFVFLFGDPPEIPLQLKDKVKKIELEIPHAFGALPPEGQEWTIGKTAASINFVHAAEKYLETCNNEEDAGRLKEKINRIKNGKEVLTDWLSVEKALRPN